jgi:hypothetical protein
VASALKAYESALAIRRRLVREHTESADYISLLGVTLNNIAKIDLDARKFDVARGRRLEAADWQRKALACNPLNPAYRGCQAKPPGEPHHGGPNIGDTEGMTEAVHELAELRDWDPVMKALDARLSGIIKGVQEPRGKADQVRLAQRAYDKALHATAVRLWSVALAAAPKLGDDGSAQHRYHAACSAAPLRQDAVVIVHGGLRLDQL